MTSLRHLIGVRTLYREEVEAMDLSREQEALLTQINDMHQLEVAELVVWLIEELSPGQVVYAGNALRLIRAKYAQARDLTPPMF